MTADSKQNERGDESALSRWSRRKLESRQQQAESRRAPAAETPAAVPAAAEPAAAAVPEAEQPVLTDADMPDIDSLDENSDYSLFMSPGVSDQLRNLALRKLFHVPAFNIRDGLNEYDEDYTSFAKLGDIVTCDMKHRIEMEQQKLREKLAEEQQAGDPAEAESAATEDVEAGEGGDDETPDDAARLAQLDDEDAAEGDEEEF